MCAHNNTILEKKTFILLKWGLKIFRLQMETEKETNNQSERVSESEHWNYPKIVVAAAVVSRHKILYNVVYAMHIHINFASKSKNVMVLNIHTVYIDMPCRSTSFCAEKFIGKLPLLLLLL